MAKEEFHVSEGCFITEWWNTSEDAAERYAILHGEGRVEVGDLEARIVGPGDVVLIPPACRQRITNIGKTDLVFLAICTPRFTNQAYEEL